MGVGGGGGATLEFEINEYGLDTDGITLGNEAEVVVEFV